MTLTQTIHRLRERFEAATQGEWTADDDDAGGAVYVNSDAPRTCVAQTWEPEDATLIAETRNALITILDALEWQAACTKALDEAQENYVARIKELEEALLHYARDPMTGYFARAALKKGGE